MNDTIETPPPNEVDQNYRERKYKKLCGTHEFWIELDWEADHIGAGETCGVNFKVTDEPDEKEIIVRGVLKWDGCTHIEGLGTPDCMGHFCGGLEHFIELLKHLEQVRAELTGY